jgi:hypothetical protein
MEAALNEALTDLEAALLTPLVPGELGNWVQTSWQATTHLRGEIDRYFSIVLHGQYRQIAETDSDLLSRVQRMKDEEMKLLADFAIFYGDVEALAQQATQVASDESKARESRTNVEVVGCALVQQVKKQISAANTWLNEAINRDRGVGD